VLIRAKPSKIALVRIERARQRLEDSECPQDPQHVPGTHSPITVLKPQDGLAIDTCAIGQLGLREAA